MTKEINYLKNTMKTLNIIKNIIKLPFAILACILVITIWFFCINWEDKEDRKLYKHTLKAILWS